MPENTQMHLHKKLFEKDSVEKGPIREGFGIGLKEAAEKDTQVVGLCADLTDSTKMSIFADAFPERFIQVGVAEQNLATVATGMAAEGKIAFAASYAAFSPGRNWEQIRTTICYNNQNVKIVGSHAGLTVGPDGATHQALEDIALMRVLPNMKVVVPADLEEARKATKALAQDSSPAYLRVAREKSPIFTTAKTPFTLGAAYVYWKGSDVTLVACGAMVYEALVTARLLETKGISVEVLNVPTIKPLDEATILRSVQKTGAVVSVEEHQIAGGLGGVVAELLAQKLPTPMECVGVEDQYGESGTAAELWEHFGLTPKHIIKKIQQVIKRKH